MYQTDKVDIHYCNMCSRLFVLANERGYDSIKFIERLMKSDIATHLFDNEDSSIWIGETYVMGVVDDELHFVQGDTIDNDIMEWIGYLFKYWSYLTGELPSDIMEQAPVQTLIDSYTGLHCLSCEMAVEDLKELYIENKKWQENE